MEKAILVGLDLGNSHDFQSSMEELRRLAEACDVDVVGTCTQKADSPTPNYYIGKGKVEQLKEDITVLDANLVIFDDELSPSHIRNLEKALEVKIVDRTILILDIFASRAKTKEAMLQVELAQSMYFLPRVVGMYKSLSRQKSGTGSKGPGEQQLELDRRILRDRIAKVKRELKEVVETRRTQRRKRKQSEVKTVALAGYTNSGKSTLMNSILSESLKKTEKYVFEKDMLFATLETQTREIRRENHHDFLLTDTVGFISKLPHHLVEAFKSTLEEIKEANLLLHVVDVSNPDYPQQLDVVETVLTELGVENIPIIHVFNKIDLLDQPPHNGYPNAVYISALNQDNMDELMVTIDRFLYADMHLVKLLIPFDKGQILNILQENANVRETEYTSEGIRVLAEITDVQYRKYTDYIL